MSASFTSDLLNIYSKIVRAKEPKFWEKVYPTPCVMCQLLRVTCHLSCVTCYVSPGTCHLSNVTFFCIIKIKLQSGGASCGGSVIKFWPILTIVPTFEFLFVSLFFTFYYGRYANICTIGQAGTTKMAFFYAYLCVKIPHTGDTISLDRCI